MHESWEDLSSVPIDAQHETMQDRTRRVRFDLSDILDFHHITASDIRYGRLHGFYRSELSSLWKTPFDTLSQADQVDYLLLQNFLRRESQQLSLERHQTSFALIPFAQLIVVLCESRELVQDTSGSQVAQDLDEIRREVHKAHEAFKQLDNDTHEKQVVYKSIQILTNLRENLHEYYQFYHSYDPEFDWWATTPWCQADAALSDYISTLKDHLHLKDKPDQIIGEPIGRHRLMVELEGESIPYTPEELIKHAKTMFTWCSNEMQKAAEELGYKSWHEALDHVKKQTEPPGKQPQLVKKLAREGTAFVKKHDLVTVPDVCDETYRMFMMSAQRQKESPFFLGGPCIIVSYPTADMSLPDKQMVMRGNNRHFCRATAFHELIPGHRLQLHMADRHNTHRQLFETPFYVEGWAMYWELVFWRMGNFFETPEDRIGTLFWRMHRCARVIFSLQFHLGKMTPAECVDLLVNWVGHERSNAEAEVRRSFSGEYAPLYQIGYLVGALQLFALREEVLDSGIMAEKEFHDEVLKANTMPVEMLRALLLDLPLTPDYKSQWRFLQTSANDGLSSHANSS